MKTILDKLPSEKAQKELKQFSIASLAIGAIGLLIGWLGVIALAFGVRALLLTKHQGNKANPKRKQYLGFAAAGAILGIVNLLLFV